LQRILFMALPMAIGSLFLFHRYLGGDMVKAWTITLTVLAVFQWFNAWNCRHESESIFTRNLFSNKYLIGATSIVAGLQLFALYHPFMQRFLRTTGLSIKEWLVIILIASSIIIVEEIRKYFYRRQLLKLNN
jgi:P-type Ca2+ transporter type 2C